MTDQSPESAAGAGPRHDRQSGEQLFASLYAELHRLADQKLRSWPGADVSPTTLVHEAYVNFAGRDASFADRERFLGYAARAMRGLLVDFARRRQAMKRGAGLHITHIDTQLGSQLADGGPRADGVQLADGAELQRLSDALDELAVLDARLAEVVDLKYFCGMSFAEIAALRGTSERTIQRDWEKARLLLYRQLGES